MDKSFPSHSLTSDFRFLSMAIKINVSPKDQAAINKLFEKVGFTRQRRKFHCTVGFIEKGIPESETHVFGKNITQALQETIESSPLFYEVEKADLLFGRIIAFIPTQKSIENLKEINRWLFDTVKELSNGRWRLNEETLPSNYIPHLTLWGIHHSDRRFKKLEENIQAHPSYHLSEAAYVIFY